MVNAIELKSGIHSRRRRHGGDRGSDTRTRVHEPRRRLFHEEAAPGKLSLAACESYENGVVYLGYRPQA
jgi:hypothetical protein